MKDNSICMDLMKEEHTIDEEDHKDAHVLKKFDVFEENEDVDEEPPNIHKRYNVTTIELMR
ncbi:hypothetical protein CR513_44046, partial [Mucuna pruriens]